MPDENKSERIRIPDPRNMIRIPGAQEFAESHIIPGFMRGEGKTDRDQISKPRSNEIEVPKDWKDIKKISHTRGVPIDINHLENLSHVVELPLYEATYYLNRAGIRTVETNAHFEGDEEETNISLAIDARTLNEARMNEAKQMLKENIGWQYVENSGEGFPMFGLNWRISRSEVTPRDVVEKVAEDVQRLINADSRVKIRIRERS